MNTESRYLYRYVVFCTAECINGILYLVCNFINEYQGSIIGFLIGCIYVFMGIWRILEVTVLNGYFNSLKRSSLNDSTLSYPPNQSLFQANMIKGV